MTSFYQKYKDESAPHPTFWVLYSLRQGDGAFTGRFFVLRHDEMARIQADRVPATAGLAYADRVAALSRGVDNVLIDHVSEHEDAWGKVVRYCSETA